MEEKFLPIGTVVMLKGGSKRLMITGFCTMDAKNPDTMFDYCGCLYPEGIVRSDQNGLFNHDQIERVYHKGLVDEEERQFKAKLNELLASNPNGMSGTSSNNNNNGNFVNPGNSSGFTVSNQ